MSDSYEECPKACNSLTEHTCYGYYLKALNGEKSNDDNIKCHLWINSDFSGNKKGQFEKDHKKDGFCFIKLAPKTNGYCYVN